MPFGDILARANEIELSTTDEKVVKIKGSLPRLALRIFGIPHIGMRVRAREIFKTLNADVFDIVMDYGCGPGIHALQIADKDIAVIGFDIDNTKIKQAKRLAADIGVDHKAIFTSTPQDADRCIDWLICSDVLEHIEDDVSVARQLWNFLEDDGRLIITVPTKTKLNAKYREEFGHYREYDRRMLENMFPEAEVEYYSETIRGPATLAWRLNRAVFSNKYLTVLTWWPLYALTYMDWFGKGQSQIMVLKK